MFWGFYDMTTSEEKNELSKAFELLQNDAKRQKTNLSIKITTNDIKNTLKTKDSAISYEDGAARTSMARAQREEAVNELIDLMKNPIRNEQENKIKYRGAILVGFLLYFLMITLIIFDMIRVFQRGGFTNNEAKVVQFLVTGFFVNLIALATVIFKYLFDDKNSLMKDMIQLIVETLKENKNEKE